MSEENTFSTEHFLNIQYLESLFSAEIDRKNQLFNNLMGLKSKSQSSISTYYWLTKAKLFDQLLGKWSNISHSYIDSEAGKIYLKLI